LLELVGRYEVRERIGEGAMADVYRAYDPSIDRVLAIKVLKGEYRQNRQYASRFLREAKAAGALSHPSIVTIYDVGEVDGYPYIVMELLDGEPLDKVMQRDEKLPTQTIMGIGLQLAEALRYAHGLGVIHRDIKPSNIILGKDGASIKIVDFGIARIADGLDDAEHLKTQVGQVLGTPRYMSPEQALGAEIDGRSDLFSVGVVLYELITGRKAFAGASAATLALQITQQDPEPLEGLAPDSPRGLRFIIDKLLAKRPDRRFADGTQLAEALRREQAALAAVLAESAGGRRNLPLQARLTLIMASITAIVLVISIGTVLDRQYQAMQRMALTSGSAIASFVASNAALQAADNATLPPAERDWLPVEAFIKTASADRNVQQMTVVDSEGVIRASTNEALVGKAYHAPQGEPVLRKDGDLVITDAPDFKGVDGFRFVRPILYGGHAFGAVDVTVSKAELQSAANLSRLLLAGLGLVILGVVGMASFGAAQLVARPIRRLKAALADAAKGDLDFRISHERKDEFGELFDGFNRFTAAVQDRLEAAETLVRAPLPAAKPVPVKSASKRAPKAASPGPFASPADETCILPPPEADQTRIGPEPALADATLIHTPRRAVG
jgi:tRNA A-37 threonylcarbamoyl transferase component Bud32/HAMP domain-containing protein